MGEFIESLKFTCLTLKSMPSLSPVDRHRAVECLSCLMCKVPAEVEQADALPSTFSWYCKQMSHGRSIGCYFFHIFGLVEVILLFKLASKYGTEIVWYSQAQKGCGRPWGENTSVRWVFWGDIWVQWLRHCASAARGHRFNPWSGN